MSTIRLALLMFSLCFEAIQASTYPAKRQLDLIDIDDVCGINPVDCSNGFCCSNGQECINDAEPEPLCRDTSFTHLGGIPLTGPAAPFSSLQAFASDVNAQISSDIQLLSSLQLTAPTPSVTEEPNAGTSTALPAETGTVVPSRPSVEETAAVSSARRTEAAPSAESTGRAAMYTVNAGALVGGMFGVGVGVLASI